MLVIPTTMVTEGRKHYLKPDDTWCTTKDHHFILYWKQERYPRTIPWDPSINASRIRSAPSSNTYHVFVAAYEKSIREKTYNMSATQTQCQTMKAIQNKCTPPKVPHLCSNQSHSMATYEPSTQGRRMCTTLRHQELRFLRNPLIMSY